jgi:rfaE bifunctional protein nucleotidyltransferase chain/domain
MSKPRNNKRVDLATLLDLRAGWRRDGRTVVWSNGCFDLLHAGHVRSLRAASSHGAVLVVGLNSDSSVRRLKGAGRPLMPVEDRVEVVAALECVDHVVVFDDPDPTALLAQVQPEVHCKGADYAPPHGKPIPEQAVVEAYGGRVVFLPLLAGISTTELLRRIGTHEETAS